MTSGESAWGRAGGERISHPTLPSLLHFFPFRYDRFSFCLFDLDVDFRISEYEVGARRVRRCFDSRDRERLLSVLLC